MSPSEFHDLVGRTLAARNQFDTARAALTTEDRLQPLSRVTPCRPPSERSTSLHGALGGGGFAREFERATDESSRFCASWVRTMDASTNAVEQMRAHVALGGALEAKGDKDGACEAYRFVLDRWPAPKPRSVSVDASRARVAALGCKR